MEITNLSDAEFQTLVIRRLREVIEYGNSVKEDVRVTLSDIKKNPWGTNSEGEEAKIQINDLENKEKINIQPREQEEIRI